MDEENIIDVEEVKVPVVEFKQTHKPWYVRIKQIVRLEDGTIYGLGSDSKMYNWHHSFAHSGKWVLLVTGR